MYQIEVNTDQNILIISISDVFDVTEAENMYREIELKVPQLKQGFKILNNLEMLEEMELETSVYHHKIMKYCNRIGVSKVARVIPDEEKDIGFNIMSIFNYEQGVSIQTFQDLTEAMKFLLK